MKIPPAQMQRALYALKLFGMGYAAGRGVATASAAFGPDCSGCSSEELRKFLGFSCAEWRAICGPQGQDCPVIACGEPESE